MGFFSSLLGVKAEQIGSDIVTAIVGLDPEGASRAQLDQMEKDLDSAGALIQKLRADYDREVREARDAQKKYDMLLGAADVLSKRLETAIDSAKPGLEASLAKLLGQLETLAPEVAQEKQDAVEVEALLDEATTAYKEKSEALLKAKGDLERAKRDMQRADLARETAEKRAETAAAVAGLRSSTTSGLNVATAAMQKRTDEARAATAAAKLKAESLSSNATGTDANITAALKEVQTGATSTETLSERLARLKK